MLKRSTGDRAERRAERFLTDQGLSVVARNWHCRQGEIDLVMRDGDMLVFVEVRLRSARGFGSGVESVDYFKQRKLAQTASLYLARNPRWADAPCRFDVIGVDGETDAIEWIDNAFEL
ncbi:MAG: YraN family protein [Wenzhouxiangellaceae bacterium]|nr:YraN family protein [Wenzhouxiangellaceae bacterium]